jgi:hypothetical protein
VAPRHRPPKHDPLDPRGPTDSPNAPRTGLPARHAGRAAALFFLRLIILYAVLVAPWPGLREGYAAAYRAACNWAFARFGSEGYVQFRPLPAGAGKMDSEIFLGNLRTHASRTAQHNIRLIGYLPTAEVIALVLATPLPWRRRAWALLWALLLVHALVAARVAVALLYGFSGDHPVALWSPGPIWTALLSATYNVTVVWVSFAFVAPVFIWIVATFRRRDLLDWLDTRAPGRPVR